MNASMLRRLKARRTDEVDIFPFIDRVSFELSNLCNYSYLHGMCPAFVQDKPVTLPSRVVLDAIKTLGERDFDGGIAFHNYNEPMADPRLFKFIEYAHRACPKSKILIWTNGWNLNQTMMNELVAAGVSIVYATAYNAQEKSRLTCISAPIEFNVIDPMWVEVINAYKATSTDDTRPCLAPLTDLRVSKEGWVVLCCRDWKGEYRFFDLNTGRFEETLRQKSLLEAYMRLRNGDRYFPLCKRCGTVRDWRRLRGSDRQGASDSVSTSPIPVTKRILRSVRT
jgi:hypothetical protein